jgi:iron complex transport system ATP-binding protein
MLCIQNISINYGTSEVIKDIDFTLRENKIVAVLGANGAGKTTLLKALNGSLPVTKGTILLDNKPLQSFSRAAIARKIAVVAQENETKFPVTVMEFVLSGRFAQPSGVFGWENEDDLRIAENALEMCDLRDYETRLMNELSGGERQRVVFARALATQARILLLDEPTANLDLSHQAILFRLVRERCQTCDSAAVIITHDLNLASEFADEILLLKQGELVAKGSPKEILTTENLQAVFEVEVFLDGHPVTGKPRITMNYV